MDPEVLKQLAKGAVPVGAALAVVFALLWRGTSTDKPADRWRVALGVLAAAAGYLLTHHFVFDPITLPPGQAFQTIPLVVTFAAVVLVVGMFVPGGTLVATVIAALSGAAMSMMVLARRTGWSDLPWLELGTFAGLTAMSMLAISWYSSRRPAAASGVLLLGFAAGGSQLLVLSMSSLKHGQVAGVSAAVAGAVVAASLLAMRASLGGLWALLVLIVAVAMEQGWRYGGGSGSAPLRSVLLASAVLPLAAVAHAMLPEKLIGVKRYALEIAIAALPMLVALGFAGYEFAKQQSE